MFRPVRPGAVGRPGPHVAALPVEQVGGHRSDPGPSLEFGRHEPEVEAGEISESLQGGVIDLDFRFDGRDDPPRGGPAGEPGERVERDQYVAVAPGVEGGGLRLEVRRARDVARRTASGDHERRRSR